MDRSSQSGVQLPYKALAQYVNFRIRKIFTKPSKRWITALHALPGAAGGAP
jgi:hypothetical protein